MSPCVDRSLFPRTYRMSSFNSESDLDFASTVILLHKYWNDLKARVEKGNTECRSEFIRILNRMVTLHGKTNIPVACAVQVVLCHVNSFYLNHKDPPLFPSIPSLPIAPSPPLVT